MRARLILNQWIIIVLVAINLKICQLVSLTSITDCYSSLLLVYNQNTALPASTTSNFTYSFPSAFINTPAVAVGNAGYASLDRLYNQFWSITYSLTNNNSAIVIHVRVEVNTQTNKQYVNYFAIDDSYLNINLFHIYGVEFNSAQLVNTSTSSGNRVDIIQYSPPTPTEFATNSLVSCITNTLYMRNSATSGFSVSCSLLLQFNVTSNETYANSLQFTIKSTGQNILQKIGFYTIIVNKNLIRGVNYYQSYVGSYSIYTNEALVYVHELDFNYSSTNIMSKNFTQLSNANIMVGFSSLDGNSALLINFNWQFDSVNSTDVIKISNFMGMSVITFNYLIFGKVDCSQFWSIAQQDCVTSCSANQIIYLNTTICKSCNSPCLTCQQTTTRCRSCVSGYYLQANRCLTCNNQTLTRAQKILCNITIPPDPPQYNKEIQSISSSPPYWVAAFAIIPIIVLIIIFILRQKRLRATVIDQNSVEFKQFPSIEL